MHAKRAMEEIPFCPHAGALATSTSASRNLLRICGLNIEARLCVLAYLKALQIMDRKDRHVWHHARQQLRVQVPENMRTDCFARMPKRNLSIAASRLVREKSLASLDKFLSAFRASPCGPVLRQPLVVDSLFSLALFSLCPPKCQGIFLSHQVRSKC